VGNGHHSVEISRDGIGWLLDTVQWLAPFHSPVPSNLNVNLWSVV